MRPQTTILPLLLRLLLTAACLPSCVKIQTLPDHTSQEITMQDPVITRAVAQMEASIGVYAYKTEQTAGTPWTDVLSVSSEYLSNVAFKKQGDYWLGWDITKQEHHAYSYPPGESLLFAGYCPHKDASEIISDVSFVPNVADKNPYLAITFAHEVTDMTTHKEADLSNLPDLLWFDIADANSGQTADVSSDAVTLNFRHALSMVSLSFSDSAQWYKLTDVRLTGCIYSGKFYSGNTAGWMPDIDNVADYVMFPMEPTTSSVTLDGWHCDDLFLIPQYLDGIFPVIGGTVESEIDVKLEFTVTDKNNFGAQKVEILMKDHTQRWELGKHYKYNIVVNADPIDFGAPIVSVTTQTVAI